MRLIFSPEAISDLRKLRRYIQEDNPKAAAKVSDMILRRISQLEKFPDMGPLVLDSKTRRRLFVPSLPYSVFYSVQESVIQILRVYHTARQWPD